MNNEFELASVGGGQAVEVERGAVTILGTKPARNAAAHHRRKRTRLRFQFSRKGRAGGK